jgi:glycerol-3-phosphate dehydrogenase (NAD(P)+)
MNKILIIGTGAYGTSLAELLVNNPNNEILMYGVDEKEVEEINTKNTNTKYFKDIVLDKKIKATTNLEEGLKGKDIIFLVTPSDVIIKVVRNLMTMVDKKMI